MTEDVTHTPPPASMALTGHDPTVRLSPLFEALLNSARHLLQLTPPQPSAAVIIAQTAIEVCTERVISKFIDRRGLTFLRAWIEDRLVNYNIQRDDVKALYKALTQDGTITAQVFWTSNRLKQHVELRNDIAHRGKVAEFEDGKASVELAEQLEQKIAALRGKIRLEIGENLGIRGIASWKWREQWQLDQEALKRDAPEVYERFKRLSACRVFHLE